MTSGNTQERRRKKLFSRLVAVAVIVVAILLARGLVKTAPETPAAEAPQRATVVSVQPVTLQSLPPTLRLYGKLETPTSATLSARIEARVIAVPVEEGDRVEQGELLVELDPQDARLRLAQASARTAEAQAALATEQDRFAADQAALKNEQSLVRIASAELDRVRQLQEEGLASQAQMDTARSALEQRLLSVTARETALKQHRSRKAQLEAQLASAKAAEQDAALDLRRSRITAPFKGLVSRVTVSPGDVVNPGNALVGLYDPSRLEVRAPIPSRMHAPIQRALDSGSLPGAEIVVGDHHLPATLKRISAATRDNTGNLDAFISADSLSSLLRLGQTVSVLVRLNPEPDVVAAPFSALYGSNRVYVLDEGPEGGTMRGITVQRVGEHLTDNDQTRLLLRGEGLKNGMQLITNQVARAVDGFPVTTTASGSDTE